MPLTEIVLTILIAPVPPYVPAVVLTGMLALLSQV